MYYSNSFGPRQYQSLESTVYSSMDAVAKMYVGSGAKADNFYSTSNLEQKYDTKRPEAQVDVVIVKDSTFDLFLKHSPLLRSLESKEVEELYKDFLKGEGKHLLKFLKDKGRRFIHLEGFARMKLDENAIAAVIRTGDRAILAVNTDFDEKIFNFAKTNDISFKDAVLYVFSHETVHLADELSEKRTEMLVGDFFTAYSEDKVVEKERFERLKNVAYRRAEMVS